MLLLAAIATFLTTLLIIITAYLFFTKEKSEIQARIARYTENAPPSAKEDGGVSGSRNDMGGMRLFIRQTSKYFESLYWSKMMEHKLLQAGVPLRGSEFMVVCFGAAFGGGLLLFLFSGGKPGLIFSGGALGFLMPMIILRLKIRRRLKAFNNQLGDALILIANSLRTGYSFLQAIEMVAREMPSPISVEFGRLLKEMNLGVLAEDALNNMAKRMNSDDLDLVVTAVVIQRQVGGNLSEILDNIASTIRERVKIRGEIRTLTAQGRISGLIIGMLPVGVGFFIFLINPEYIRVLFAYPVGRAMLAGAVMSQMLGIIFIRRIVNIEV